MADVSNKLNYEVFPGSAVRVPKLHYVVNEKKSCLNFVPFPASFATLLILQTY